MDLYEALARHGGIARSASLVAEGVPRSRIRRAVAAGEVQSPRRGWIARKGADPALIAAARIGVVVSCVSQARRLELWTHPSTQWHVAAAPHTALLQQTDAHVHWSTPLVPRPPGVFEDSIENVLALVAACQPREHALAIWESALSRGLVDRETMSGYPLRPAARELCELMMPFADSGLETIVVPRLRWLRLPMRRQIWIAGHRVDLLIGERLVLQIDGGTHVDAQRMQAGPQSRTSMPAAAANAGASIRTCSSVSVAPRSARTSR